MMGYKAHFYDVVDFSIGRSGLTKDINGHRVKLPARWYRSFPHDYEAGNFIFLRKHLREGNVALDVGAHVGLYSVAMAQVVGSSGKVHPFEPSPVTRAELERIVRMNDVAEQVILLSLA